MINCLNCGRELDPPHDAQGSPEDSSWRCAVCDLYLSPDGARMVDCMEIYDYFRECDVCGDLVVDCLWTGRHPNAAEHAEIKAEERMDSERSAS